LRIACPGISLRQAKNLLVFSRLTAIDLDPTSTFLYLAGARTLRAARHHMATALDDILARPHR
jgi:hypothetical protein